MKDNFIRGIDTNIDISHIKRAYGIGRVKSEPLEGKIKEDRVYLSDEVKGKGSADTSNVDYIKEAILKIKEKAGSPSSGEDVSFSLIKDAMAVQMEKNGVGVGTDQVGLKPGVFNGGVLTSKNFTGSYKQGVKEGGVFSSRRESRVGYQPGGGTASPNMVKLQVSYAKAIKQGNSISQEAEEMVLKTLSSSKAGEKPIKALLGM